MARFKTIDIGCRCHESRYHDIGCSSPSNNSISNSWVYQAV